MTNNNGQQSKEDLLQEIAALRQRLALLEKPSSAKGAVQVPAHHIAPNNSPNPFICLHDLAGNIIRANDEAEELFELHHRDGSWLNLCSLLAPDVRAEFNAYLQKVQAEKAIGGLMKALDKQGKLRLLAYEATLVEQAGQAAYVWCEARDISTRHFVDENIYEFYKNIFETNTSAILLLDRRDMVLEANQAASTLFGQSKDYLVGQRFAALLQQHTQATEAQAAQATAEAWAGGKPRLILPGKAAHSRRTFYELAFNKSRYYNKEVVICTLRDLSTEFNDEQELIARYNELRIVKETLRAIAGMHRIDEILLTSIAKLFELNYVKAAGFFQTSRDLYRALLKFHLNLSPGLLAQLREINTRDFAQVFTDKQALELPEQSLGPEQDTPLLLLPLVVEHRVTHALLFEIEKSRPNAGLLLNLLATEISSFITQVQLVNKLTQSENRFRIIADNSPSMLRAADADGNFNYFSKPWITFTGKSAEQQTGSGWLQQVHPDDRPALLEVLKTAFGKRTGFKTSYRLLHHDYQFRWVLDNGTPYSDRQGEFKGYICSAIDITEQKMLEGERSKEVALALSESNHMLQELFDNANDLIQIVSKKGNFLFVNKAWRKALEYHDDEARHLKIDDVIHPEHLEHTRRVLEKIAQTGEAMSLETAYVSKTGRKIHLTGSVSAKQEADGTLIFRLILHDITERIRAEKAQALYYRMAKLTMGSPNLPSLYHNFYLGIRETLEVDSFMIAIKNERDDNVYFPYYVNSDYAPDEGIQGRTIAEYVVNYDRPMFFYDDTIRRIMDRKKIPREEVIPKVWMSVPLKMDSRIMGMLVLQSFKDRRTYNKRDLELLSFISSQLATAIQRNQSQEKINEQAARLQSVFDSGSHLMWSVNRDMKISRFNRNFVNVTKQLHGIEATPNMPLINIYQSNDKDQVYFWLEKYRTALSGYPQHFERKIIGINGEEVWHEVFLNPIVTSNSFEVDEVSGLAHDITAKKRASEELRKAKDIAERSLEAKKRFLSNMSHEIRTPMNGIIGMIDLLSESEHLKDEHRGYISTVKKSSETLLNILNDILDLSKIEAGKMELRKMPISLPRLIEKLYALFSQKALQQNVRLVYHIDADVPSHLLADETRLLQILSNLTSNALKFTEKGKIEIRVSRMPAEPPQYQPILIWEENTDPDRQPFKLKMEVIDTGIGISEENQEILFQKFSQVDNSYTKSYGGTGLGLAISQELCRLMNGDIGVSSRLGEGSTFWFTFETLAADTTELPGEQENERETPILGQIKSLPAVLVVDDNAVNLNVASSILERAGCRVTTAQSGKEAIQLVKEHSYDLIFMDVQMPVMNGITTTQVIKGLDLPAMPPIVAMTAFSMQEERDTFLNSGMDDYIAKPIKAQGLINKVKKWVKAERDEMLNDLGIKAEHLPPPKPKGISASFLVLNPDTAQQLKKYGGDELIEASYTEFEEETTQLLEACHKALIHQDMPEVKSNLHTIKGNAGTLGIERVAEQARLIEAKIKEGGTEGLLLDFNVLQDFFNEFRQSYKSILNLN